MELFITEAQLRARAHAQTYTRFDQSEGFVPHPDPVPRPDIITPWIIERRAQRACRGLLSMITPFIERRIKLTSGNGLRK